MIGEAAAAVPPGRAVVLGAGRADEIPLADLVARFAQVTLNDVELALMGHTMAAAKIDQKSRQKVITHVGDLTGITAALLAKIGAAVDAGTETGAVIEQMAALVAAHAAAGMFPAGKFDLVVASCVLSQLHVGLVYGAREAFARRFPNDVHTLDASERWIGAVYQLARRVEKQFIDDLGSLVAEQGLIYLSESVQMCYIELTPSGQWKSEGTWRMLRTKDLADYVDNRFTITQRGRWEWIVARPEKVGQIGRLFDVQALVLRRVPA